MQQYFVNTLFENECLSLDKEQSHHILHVLRMKEHEKIRIVDKEGTVYLSEIHICGKQVIAQRLQMLPPNISPISITLALALIKKERFDFAIQKACELGVKQIQPFVSSRCVVKCKKDDANRKMERWNKIALEACEQCKRTDLVEVMPPCSINDLIGMHADVKLCAYEHADHHANALKNILKKQNTVQSFLCVIGPEGGFQESEAKTLISHGFLCTSLGPRILRAETAAMSIVNTISVYYES